MNQEALVDTKLDGLERQPNLSARQREFCANLLKVIRNPELDLLNAARISFSSGGKRLQLVLPHLTDPALTIYVGLSENSLHSLKVWDFEFVNIFATVFGSSDSPDFWLLKTTDLLRGKVFLEKWIRGGSVLGSRASHYSGDLGRWMAGNLMQTRKRGIFNYTRSLAGREALPKDAIRQGKHVCFCSVHNIPKFDGTL